VWRFGQSDIGDWPNIGEIVFENIGIGFKKGYRSVSNYEYIAVLGYNRNHLVN